MDQNEITYILNIAKGRFIENDNYLLSAEANERSITHKFAEHLQNIFGCYWHVDCEYNRFGKDGKKIVEEIEQIVGSSTITSEIKTHTVYPDIIIHRRGPDGPNLLVIEAKNDATDEERKKDIKKLKEIKREYGYFFAVFLDFRIENKDIIIEFVNND